jgi:hypothetical protein
MHLSSISKTGKKWRIKCRRLNGCVKKRRKWKGKRIKSGLWKCVGLWEWNGRKKCVRGFWRLRGKWNQIVMLKRG